MTTLTQKSQVTVPKSMRAFLGVKPGDDVEFAIEGRKVILQKKKKELPLEKWLGYLGEFDTDFLMKEIR